MEYFETMAPGVILVGRFGWLETGVWLFRNDEECMILEMPDFDMDDNKNPNPWSLIQEYIQKEKLKIKFMTCTHAHLDHIDSFKQFNNAFPEIPIVWHEKFFKWGSYLGFKPFKKAYHENFMQGAFDFKNNPPSIICQKVPIYLWQGDCFKTNIGSEPLYILHVPKHSNSDTMIIFRGTMITGDWWWGPGDPNKNRVNLDVINQSIDKLINFVKNHNYIIKNLFSVHANEFHRDLTLDEYISLLESTRPKK